VPTDSRATRVLLMLCAVILAGCGRGAAQSPEWVPQPETRANVDPTPALPANPIPAPEPPSPGAPSSGSPAPQNPPGSSPRSAADTSVVASKLNQPTGLVVLPDGTALVGERTTGRIYRVASQPGQPRVLAQTLPGVNGAGDGGLLDLALSPTYDQDGLVYALITTATDNRVIHFVVGARPSTVITGIPRGTTGNTGRLAFDATGALLTGTGSAGRPSLAADPASLAGKLLRTTDIGRPAAGNPIPTSRIYASGFGTVDGLCVDPTRGTRVVISAGTPDRVQVVVAGKNYSGPVSGAVLPASAAGGAGCALVAGRLAVATARGQAVDLATVSRAGTISAFSASLRFRYGRLRTVVAGSDGSLWLTTANRDPAGHPSASDDRVIRIDPAAAADPSQL
jgi:glucose/arabinose dehydrogenase